MTMKSDEDRKTHFVTADLTLATTLLALGYRIENLTVSNPTRANFSFHSSDSLKRAVADFWSRQILVEPINFNDVQRQLKARIRNEQMI